MKDKIETLASRFKPGEIGSAVKFYEVMDSTNRLALEIPSEEIRHGMVLVAGKQTAGRGRAGRSWLSLPDVGLHFTAILKPEEPLENIQLINFVGALGVHEALKKFCQGQVDIKWPNDVILSGGKVSGILSETVCLGSVVERIALGISINIGHRPEDFTALDAPPTPPISILMSEGRAPPLDNLLQHVLSALNRWYEILVTGRPEVLIDEICRRSSYVSGKRLIVETGGGQLDVTSAGLNQDGSLQVRLASGAEMTLLAGEVRVLE